MVSWYRDRWSVSKARARASSARPHRLGLVGTCIDQVDADPVEHLLRRVERGKAFRHIVQPAQLLQRRVIQRLKPKRYAVDASGGNIGETLCLDRGRIRLQRYLDIGGKTPQRLGLAQQRGHQRRRHERRRTTTKEYRCQRCPVACAMFVAHVRNKVALPNCGVDRGAHMAVEVAVRTLLGAEWPVDIKRARHRYPAGNCAATSFANASARWLFACFAAGSISANVCSLPCGTNTGS